MTKEKVPVFEQFKMKGNYDVAKVIYEELVQWGRCEKDDESHLREYIYNFGLTLSDMPYFGWVGEELREEKRKAYAVINAYKAFLSVLQDVLGIKSEWYEDELNDDEECRYQILDTKGE